MRLSRPLRPSPPRTGMRTCLRGPVAGGPRGVALVAVALAAAALLALAGLLPTPAAGAPGSTGASTAFPTTTSSQVTATSPSTTAAPAPQAPVSTTAVAATSGQGAPTGLIPPAPTASPLNPGWRTDRIDIRVMPEYDEKAVLVIMGFSLPADVALPATLKFALPSGARITGIGEVDPAGNFVYNYTTTYPPVQPGPQWDVASIEVKTYRQLQIDYYYDPGLPAGAGDRSFPLLVQLPMDAATVILHVQHPARATDFKAEPALSGSGQAGDGFTYSVATFSDVKAGSTLGHTISYYKPDGALSIDTEGADGNGEGRPASMNTNTVLLTAILVVVVIIGALVVYRLFLAPRASTRRPNRPSAPGALQSASRKTPPKAFGRHKKGAKAAPAAQRKPAQTTTQAAPRQAGRTAEQVAADRVTSPVTAGRPQEATDGEAERSPEPADTTRVEQGGETPSYCVACGEELSPKSPLCPVCGEAQP